MHPAEPEPDPDEDTGSEASEVPSSHGSDTESVKEARKVQRHEAIAAAIDRVCGWRLDQLT